MAALNGANLVTRAELEDKLGKDVPIPSRAYPQFPATKWARCHKASASWLLLLMFVHLRLIIHQGIIISFGPSWRTTEQPLLLQLRAHLGKPVRLQQPCKGNACETLANWAVAMALSLSNS